MADSILGIVWCVATLGIGCSSGCDTPESEPEAEPPQPLPPRNEYDIFVKLYVSQCEQTALYFSHRPLCGVGKYPQLAIGSSNASLYIPSTDEFKNSSFHIPPLPDGGPEATGGCLIDCSWTANKYPSPTINEQGTFQKNAFCEVRIEVNPYKETIPAGIKNLSTPVGTQQHECKIIDSLYEYVFGIPLPQHH
ncbi:MAG: hypothetical protein HYU97_01225 [Deltaproteobacteria bacterium]|nr:hypothetical protein [Deltaproteobacteria bacterium]